MKICVSVIVESETGEFPGWQEFGAILANALDKAGNSGVLVWQPAPLPGAVLLPIKRYRAIGTVNYRNGAGTEYEIKGQLHAGDEVSELTRSGEWIGHELGHSHQKYLELIPE